MSASRDELVVLEALDVARGYSTLLRRLVRPLLGRPHRFRVLALRELLPPGTDSHGPSLRGAVLALRVFLHLFEARVVVRELVQVRERDLAGGDGVIVGHVRLRVVEAVLQLDVHPGAELFDVERGTAPLDPDLLADPLCLVSAEALRNGHVDESTKTVSDTGFRQG